MHNLTRDDQQGFSLLEVLIALIVLALVATTGLLSMTHSLKSQQQSLQRVQAMIRAKSLLARFRALPKKDQTSARLSAYDDWNAINLSQLPDGHGSYSCDFLGTHCSVTVTWRWHQQLQRLAIRGVL